MVQQSDAHWLRTDELTEAVRSLEHAADLLEAGRADAYQLKWPCVRPLASSARQMTAATWGHAPRTRRPSSFAVVRQKRPTRG